MHLQWRRRVNHYSICSPVPMYREPPHLHFTLPLPIWRVYSRFTLDPNSNLNMYSCYHPGFDSTWVWHMGKKPRKPGIFVFFSWLRVSEVESKQFDNFRGRFDGGLKLCSIYGVVEEAHLFHEWQLSTQIMVHLKIFIPRSDWLSFLWVSWWDCAFSGRVTVLQLNRVDYWLRYSTRRHLLHNCVNVTSHLRKYLLMMHIWFKK